MRGVGGRHRHWVAIPPDDGEHRCAFGGGEGLFKGLAGYAGAATRRISSPEKTMFATTASALPPVPCRAPFLIWHPRPCPCRSFFCPPSGPGPPGFSSPSQIRDNKDSLLSLIPGGPGSKRYITSDSYDERCIYNFEANFRSFHGLQDTPSRHTKWSPAQSPALKPRGFPSPMLLPRASPPLKMADMPGTQKTAPRCEVFDKSMQQVCTVSLRGGMGLGPVQLSSAMGGAPDAVRVGRMRGVEI